MELGICAATKGSLSLSLGPIFSPTLLIWLLGWGSRRAGFGGCGGCSVPATGYPQSDCKLQRDQFWINGRWSASRVGRWHVPWIWWHAWLQSSCGQWLHEATSRHSLHAFLGLLQMLCTAICRLTSSVSQDRQQLEGGTV